MIVALSRGVLFPDFSSALSVAFIHIFGPIGIAWIALHYSPKTRFCPRAIYFLTGFWFLLIAEIIGLTIYAIGGGLPYLLGADFTPSLVVVSFTLQAIVYFTTIKIGASFKYAPKP